MDFDVFLYQASGQNDPDNFSDFDEGKVYLRYWFEALHGTDVIHFALRTIPEDAAVDFGAKEQQSSRIDRDGDRPTNKRPNGNVRAAHIVADAVNADAAGRKETDSAKKARRELNENKNAHFEAVRSHFEAMDVYLQKEGKKSDLEEELYALEVTKKRRQLADDEIERIDRYLQKNDLSEADKDLLREKQRKLMLGLGDDA